MLRVFLVQSLHRIRNLDEIILTDIGPKGGRSTLAPVSTLGTLGSLGVRTLVITDST